MEFEADPQKEAERWFYSLDGLESLSALVIFGKASEHYYKAAKEWLHTSPSRYLIFLEPNEGKVPVVFSDPQVIALTVEVSINDVVQIEKYEWKWVAALLLNGPCLFSAARNYKGVYQEFWEKLKKALHYYVRALSWECSFFLPEFVRATQLNTVKNLYHLSGSRLFHDMEKSFEGVPAIICGAGPSIEADLPVLNLYKERALIFGAGTGMNVLNEHNISAHIGVGIDPDIASASRMMSHRAYETPYCFTLKFNHDALKWIHGSKLYFRGQDLYGIDSWFENALGLGRWPRIDYRISTTHACLSTAERMGCNPIILLGVDLSYTNQKKYPQNIAPHPCDRLDVSLQQLDGPHALERIEFVGEDGTSCVTRADWIREAQEYYHFSLDHPNVKIINATARGLPIPSLKRESFQVVAQNWLQKTEDIERRLAEAVGRSKVLEYSVSEIEEKIALWLERLREGEVCLKKLEDGERRQWKMLAKTDAYRHFLESIDRYYEIFFFNDKFQLKKLTGVERIEKERSFEKGRIKYLKAYLTIVQKLYAESLGMKAESEVAENPMPVKKTNTCYYYYLNGQLKSCIPHAEDGLLDGCVTLYYPNGLLKREIHFTRGVLLGLERCWDVKGSLVFECEHTKSSAGVTVDQIRKILENYE